MKRKDAGNAEIRKENGEKPDLQHLSGKSKPELLGSTYISNPTIRGLMALAGQIPIIGAFDNYLSAKIEKLLEERKREFFEELNRGHHYLTYDLIEKEDFVFGFAVCFAAAMRTRQRKNVKLFARLLTSAVKKNLIHGDIFDEFKSILEDLSIRELNILHRLQEFEDTHPYLVVQGDNSTQLENDAQRAQHYWNSFIDSVCAENNIPFEILPSILNRLARTGLYETFVGKYIGTVDGAGKTTSLFSEFVGWIKEVADG